MAKIKPVHILLSLAALLFIVFLVLQHNKNPQTNAPFAQSNAKNQSSSDSPGVNPLTSSNNDYDCSHLDRNNQIYCTFREKILENADASSFRILRDGHGKENSYAEDKKNYFRNEKIMAEKNDSKIKVDDEECKLIKDELVCFFGSFISSAIISDPSKLKYIGNHNFQDGWNIYMMYDQPASIFHGKSAKILRPDEGYEYYLQIDNEIYFVLVDEYERFEVIRSKLDGADSSTFKIISIRQYGMSSLSYSKDKNYVYYRGGVMDDADPKTFNGKFEDELQKKSKIENYHHAGYIADSRHIYQNGRTIITGSPNLFLLHKQCQFGIYNTKVFYSGDLIEDIDATKMKIVDKSCNILESENKKWYLIGNCDSTRYVPESEIGDPKSYEPPC